MKIVVKIRITSKAECLSYLKMEDYLNFFENGRLHLFFNGRHPRFFKGIKTNLSYGWGCDYLCLWLWLTNIDLPYVLPVRMSHWPPTKCYAEQELQESWGQICSCFRGNNYPSKYGGQVESFPYLSWHLEGGGRSWRLSC